MSVTSKRRIAVAAAAVIAAAGLVACSPDTVGDTSGSADGRSAGGSNSDAAQAGATGSAAGPVLSANVDRGATDVPVSTLVSVAAEGGALTSVQVSSETGQVAGSMSSDAATWTATQRLEPGTTYTVKAVAQDAAGDQQTRRKTRFTTQALTLSQQTYASVAPLQGETVGVGMPVIVTFDIPVRNKAEFEKNMVVNSTPQQVGAWHWLSESEAHWRPKNYWKSGTKVSVDINVNGVDAGNGIYGQQDRTVDFEIGDANIYKVSAKTYQMKVFSNGKLLRTIPITTGKAGFTTRSGTKVIVEKFESKRMNSETVGITGSEAYDIDDVQYAMRLTYSGEFIHAAPWSVGSQGNANVSHGCTGMSTDNARWLYSMSKRGDVVEYTGTDRPMTFTNGYGDWNQPFSKFARGSAL